jgi:hypothetical protein
MGTYFRVILRLYLGEYKCQELRGYIASNYGSTQFFEVQGKTSVQTTYTTNKEGFERLDFKR